MALWQLPEALQGLVFDLAAVAPLDLLEGEADTLIAEPDPLVGLHFGLDATDGEVGVLWIS